MARPLGKLIYCSKCYRRFWEKMDFPTNIECDGCLKVIAELKYIKSKRISGSRLTGKGK